MIFTAPNHSLNHTESLIFAIHEVLLSWDAILRIFGAGVMIRRSDYGAYNRCHAVTMVNFASDYGKITEKLYDYGTYDQLKLAKSPIIGRCL